MNQIPWHRRPGTWGIAFVLIVLALVFGRDSGPDDASASPAVPDVAPVVKPEPAQPQQPVIVNNQPAQPQVVVVHEPVERVVYVDHHDCAVHYPYYHRHPQPCKFWCPICRRYHR